VRRASTRGRRRRATRAATERTQGEDRVTLNCGSKGIAVSLVPVTSAARIESRRAARRRDSSILCTFNARTDGSESFTFTTQVLAQDVDLLNPPAALEARKHKLKRLVQSPNSFFMDVKCQVRRERARTCTHFFFLKFSSTVSPTRRRRRGGCASSR
jgi:hypothetical protein